MTALPGSPAIRNRLSVRPPAARERVVLDPPVARGRAAGDPPAPPATGTRRLAADPEAVDAVGEALAALHDDDAPGTVPVILAAGDYTAHAAGTFTAHCDDRARRLRPADSVGLEPSGLLRRFTELTGWRGPGYVVAEPAGDGTAALRLARGLVAADRARVVYLCEVLRRLDTGAFWAVATRVRRAPAQPLPGDPVRPALLTAGLDPVTRDRSAVLRAHLSPRPHDPAEEQQ
ncbi:hypothetical protein AQJ66_32065 [Streptomyces bungoensis]|uniref:Uncharacterized protein n=1 Tax=Streptomyces bungoensis TaxID=285568 RepID=A0A124I1N4_9ACTN|nr:hypothetical protein [Streptomyces bungoensis]KUN77861.1 hypothetical protein AQJ66_32065 [Streptomyces bungoensis]